MTDNLVTRAIVLIGVLGLVLIAFFIYQNQSRAVPSGKVITVEVKPGTSFYSFSLMLEEKEVVKSAFVLRQLASTKGVDRKLSPGKYVFKTGSDYEEVLKIIEHGPQVELVKVVIPEGFSNQQIASRMEEVLGVEKERFLKLANTGKPVFVDQFSFLKNVPVNSLEGYLFPDTYYFRKDESVEVIISRMLENFARRATSIGLLNNQKNEKGIHQIVTMASIVEKEAKLEDERPLIASVFYNRLKKGMKLQSCATVEYILGFSKPRLSNEDLKIDSPYNTYLYSGLPPGPICNPGLSSLKAALNPAQTNYLYFVLIDDSGKHYFAETYQEFLKVKSKRGVN